MTVDPVLILNKCQKMLSTNEQNHIHFAYGTFDTMITSKIMHITKAIYINNFIKQWL